MKIVGIIPSHLNSIRFPKKILYKINDLPMIEHVRRRALISKQFDEVIVCTCDLQIKKVVNSYKGKVVLTSRKHKNGTSRVTEAIKKIKASHIVIIQGDEPLIDPKYFNLFIKNIKNDQYRKNIHAWNLISQINKNSHLKNPTFVKCRINKYNLIDELYRFEKQKKTKNNTYKILGLIGFKRETLNKIKNFKPSVDEKKESIEQLRIIENKMNLKGIKVKVPLPSVNEFSDLKEVHKLLKIDKNQKKIYEKIIKINLN